MDKHNRIEQAIDGVDEGFLKALAEPVRLEILKLLVVHGASDINELASRLPQDRSVISRHLSGMEKAGMLISRKEGRHVIYSLDGNSMLEKTENFYTAVKECIALGCC